MENADYYFIRLADGTIKQVPISYFPKEGETTILEEAMVMPRKESVAEAVVSFVKKNKEPLFLGVIAYFILKKVTGVDILP
jgi:hypothetical protein